MPRPSWSGHLRLSLVSCPIYLAAATSESERIRLNQINPKTGNRISLKTVDSQTGEWVSSADTSCDGLAGRCQPADFHDRYQDELRERVEAKVRALPAAAPRPVAAPSNVVDLMAALKKSLADSPAKASAKREKKPAVRDRRQGNMLLPVKGGSGARAVAEKPAVSDKADAQRAPKRKKA